MAEPFLSEVRIMSFGFAPKGWALSNGQQLPINQNQALFSLLGTTFGGNGQTTFALPDLRGRVPIHVGGAAVGGTQVDAYNDLFLLETSGCDIDADFCHDKKIKKKQITRNKKVPALKKQK